MIPTQLLKIEDYDVKPWKNGLGTTQDVLMIPNGSTHETFDVRVAISPILDAGAFSSFKAADRVITLIEGEGLALKFDEGVSEIAPLQSFPFDTEIAPYGTPKGGPVKVINVMTRRGKWEILSCGISEQLDETQGEADLSVLIPLNDGWQVTTKETRFNPDKHETIVVSGESEIKAAALTGKCLYAKLRKIT